jgi:cobalt-zinc-cadmium efflux system outer membrane protein
MNQLKPWMVVAALVAVFNSQAQTDSLRLTIDSAENIFLQKNLHLLSQRYQVSATKALEIQAGLFANPVFSTELALAAKGRPWLDVGSQGQKAFAIDQLIQLAGKRNKRILLAREDTRQAEFALYDLLRTLRFQLRQSFISLSYSGSLVAQLNKQIALLDNIINSYEVQATKRNVSMKDVVRLKTELIQLNSQRNDILSDAIDARQAIQVLLDTSAFVIPEYETEKAATPAFSYNNLIDKAITNRADLKINESQLKQADINIRYQQALATPDISLGVGYDQNGSYAPNYINVHAGIELPFFNRNQGNILNAREQRKIAETELSIKHTSIQAELAAALAHIKQSDSTYKLIQENFEKDYPDINRGIIENFNKGNISILEFLDFFESYNGALQVINQARKQRVLAYEQLDFVVGTPLK